MIVWIEKGEICLKGVEVGGVFDVFGELIVGLFWLGGLWVLWWVGFKIKFSFGWIEF